MILTHAQRRRIDRIADGRSDEPLYLLEGPRAIVDAVETGAVAEIWLSDALDAGLAGRIEASAAARAIPVGAGSRKDFERIGRTVTPQGVLALVRDVARPLAELTAASGLIVWLDGVQDPGNVGAVVRVAAAFGAAGLVVTEGSADPMGRKALRASTGLCLKLPFARATAAEMAAAGRPLWLLERGGEDVFGIELVPDDVVLVIGSEAHGPGAVAAAASERRVGIPLAPGVDSLNAAVAAGIAVSLLQQRRSS